MSRLRDSRFPADLYRDLRDRRLLIPVVALLVALVAVPVLLSGSAEPAPPPPAVAVGEEATQVEPAVLAEAAGVRDYRKRLDALKRRNPFEQKFALPDPDSVALESDSAGGGGATPSPSTGSATAEAVAGLPSTSGQPDEVVTSTETETTTVEQAEGSKPVKPPKPPRPEVHFLAGRADVTMGPLGEAKRYRGLRYLEFLPGERSPVVAFLGLGEGAERAVFSVSSEVADSDGEGTCAPKRPARCRFLTLKVGEQRMLHLEDGRTFRLRLLGTDVVRVDDPRERGRGSNSG